PHRLHGRPHAYDQRLRAEEQPAQEGGRLALGRGPPCGTDVRAEREGARAAVRGADQDEARQLRGARRGRVGCQRQAVELPRGEPVGREDEDRKSTRLNSSHVKISYAVFCLKKKKKGKLESHNM